MIYLKRQDVIQYIADTRNNNIEDLHSKSEDYRKGFDDALLLMMANVDYIDKYQPARMEMIG